MNVIRFTNAVRPRIDRSVDGNRLVILELRYDPSEKPKGRPAGRVPLAFDHRVNGEFRGEIANLSRNVIIESTDPDSESGLLCGHTMYHRGSAGSISYAELRHLGKPGLLGRYSLHFHLCGDTMRGMSIVGASIWDSGNRWITIHGTDYLVVRDTIGYRSIGHGFFLEDGTEVDNIFDHNLAVQALQGKQLPEQILPFDSNDGAGFWWANSCNAFTRNTAVECDQYGFRFEAGHPPAFNSVMGIRQNDGSTADVDIRTLPFICFDDNEVHSVPRFALNLGGFRPAICTATVTIFFRPAGLRL